MLLQHLYSSSTLLFLVVYIVVEISSVVVRELPEPKPLAVVGVSSVVFVAPEPIIVELTSIIPEAPELPDLSDPKSILLFMSAAT